ncbi:MAG: NAD(P)/FAD-dependent oxidoreductase [Alphaproteobacteria bacterium]
MTAPDYDVAIIGAGVVGCAVAREFSRYQLRAILVEGNSDLCDESSKGNTATLATGNDTPAGSLERRLVMRGHQRYLAEGPELGLPIRLVGALTIAFTEDETKIVAEEVRAAKAEGFPEVELVGPDQIYKRVPALASGAVAASWAPTEGIVDGFSTAFAFALDAVENGVDYRASSPVTAAHREGGTWSLATPTGEIRARFVVNCGGLRADTVEAAAGYRDFVVKPRRGQYIVYDKSARRILDTILRPTPTPTTRGIYIAPSIFGNVLLGPTAEEVEDRNDRRVTQDGLDQLKAFGRRMLPSLLDEPVVALYAGMRPATDRPEYRIIPRFAQGWLTVAGIRSTGLTGSLGIAEYVCGIVVPEVVKAPRKHAIRPVRVPSLAADAPRASEDAARVAADPAYGEIVCHCERVSRGEIRDALAPPIPARSIKALRRRTRVMMGRCQGFFCGARVETLFRDPAS